MNVNYILKIFYRLYFSFFLICTIWAANASSNDILTLDDCVNRARVNSLTIRLAENGLKSSRLSQQELATTALPQARFSAGAGYAPFSSHFGYDPAVSNGGQLGSQIIVEQPLYDGGRRNIKAARLKLDIDRLTLEKRAVGRDLEFEVKTGFFEALRAGSEAGLRGQSVEQLNDYFELVTNLNASGAVGKTDLLKTEVQLNEANIAFEQALESEAIAKSSLAELMGTPDDTSFVLAGNLDSMMNSPMAVEKGTVPFDSTRNLDLNIAGLNYQRSLLDIQEIKRERMPSVSLMADAGLLTSRENLLLPQADRSSMIGYSAGIMFEMPLFDWGGRKLREQGSQLAAEALQSQTEILRRSIRSEYRKIRLQLSRAFPRLAAIRSNIKIAEESYLLTKSRYAAGGALATDVLNSQQFLIDTRLTELQLLAEIADLTALLEQILTQ